MSTVAIAYLCREKDEEEIVYCLQSIAKNTIDHTNLKIFLIHKQISLFFREQVLTQIPSSLEVEWIEVFPHSFLNDLKITALSQLEILISKEIETLLVLQGSLYFHSSVHEVLRLTVEKVSMARNLQDQYQTAAKEFLTVWKKKDISPSEIYFNTNVILINRKYWQREDLSQKIHRTYEDLEAKNIPNSLLINISLKNDIEPLAEVWNKQIPRQEYLQNKSPEKNKNAKLIQAL
ncbi:MAG: glycosyltransferase [Oligoflexia bacterium]|nr:glycosyltransferase [Oligoflexia bacterium]